MSEVCIFVDWIRRSVGVNTTGRNIDENIGACFYMRRCIASKFINKCFRDEIRLEL